jgi:hypothetical protein
MNRIMNASNQAVKSLCAKAHQVGQALVTASDPILANDTGRS